MVLELACNFDETGNTVKDVSGLARDWSIASTGLVRAIDGNTRKVLQVTGSAPAFPPNIGQTANRTVMCWLKGTMTTAGWPIQWYKSSEDTGLWGILVLSGNLSVRGRNAGGPAAASIALPGDFSTTWHHVAGTYDGSNIKLYLDATLVATTALTSPLRTDGVLQLFGYNENNYIDDLRIFSDALTAQQIALYKDIPVGSQASDAFLTYM